MELQYEEEAGPKKTKRSNRGCGGGGNIFQVTLQLHFS